MVLHNTSWGKALAGRRENRNIGWGDKGPNIRDTGDDGQMRCCHQAHNVLKNQKL